MFSSVSAQSGKSETADKQFCFYASVFCCETNVAGHTLFRSPRLKLPDQNRGKFLAFQPFHE
jgi:hypothetical protein